MQSLQYIELDIPFCSRVYGVPLCNARLTAASDPVAATFDGAATYLVRGGGLTGAADSKALTFGCWAKLSSVAAGQYFIVATTSLNGSVQRTCAGMVAGGAFFMNAYNAAGTLILDQRSTALVTNRWVHILASFDLSNAARHHIYIDDVSDIASAPAFTNDTIDFTMSDWGVGALPNASFKLSSELADLWFAPGVYIDLSIEANRRKFIDADGNPVSLGATGNTPTGTAPLVFLSGDISAWHTNKGSGGGFTLHGTLVEGDFGTGAIKCFNSKATCQDTANFAPGDVTLRFAVDAEYLPREIDCIPSIKEISYTPATISLGKDLGTRATLQVSFKDHPHSDTGEGYDKYLADRGYDPYSQGTFWGKFRARQPFLRGQSIRWITGIVGDELADMETRHFVVDSFDGPTPDGKYTLIAKDVLKLADGDRSQAPALSNGFLAADITASETSATLLPSGIGNEEYPTSGYLCIGGNEVVIFSRSGDSLNLQRAALGTTASTHKAQDRVQLVLRYVGEDVADIIDDLFETYAGVPASYITIADWRAETAAFLGTVYTANICEPTSVAALVSELIEQAALAIWDDNIAQALRLQVLRGIVTDADTFTPENTLQGTLTIKEQPETRLSRVQTYFGQKDPTKPLSNLDNYRSTSLVIDEEAEADYGSASIKTIYSRWIPEAGRTIADRLGTIILGRYRDPPRRLTFATSRYAETDIEIGRGYRVESFCVQSATGAQADIPIQITRLNPGPDRFSAEAEEMLWNVPAADLTDRQVIFDANNYNVNLRTSHDSIYPVPVAGDEVTCTINAGVIIGSVATSLPAFDIGSWPVGVTLNLIINGRIQGAGGLAGIGGAYNGSAGPGFPGGAALYTRHAINLELPAGGQIWSGGGGGGGGGGYLYITFPFNPTGSSGGGGGGGGAGQSPGSGNSGGNGYAAGSNGTSGSNGAAAVGGAGGPGGSNSGTGGFGGGPGLAGLTGNGSASGATGNIGGAAGAAIDGSSYVTTTVSGGDSRGGLIN